MAACWPLQMPPTPKAVLVSLADQSNDQGGCWPALSTLCERTCLGERAVRKALRWLEDTGILQTERRNKRDGSMTSNFYTVNPAAFRPAEPYEGEPADARHAAAAAPVFSKSPPAPHSPPPRHVVPTPPARRAPPPPAPDAGAPGTTCPLTVIEPILNTPPNPPAGGRRARTEPTGEGRTAPDRSSPMMGFDEWLAECVRRGEKAIPEQDSIFDYCDQVGIDREVLALHWVEFKRRRSAAKKRQRGVDGWRQTFRTSVRDNWYRLWFIRIGERAQLTTVGAQALMAMQAEQARRDNEAEASHSPNGAAGHGEGADA